MKLLLDTHAFLWWDDDPTQLPAHVNALFSDPANSLLLSVASIWELQIKIQLKKLSLARPLKDVIADQQTRNALQVLPIGIDHVYALDNLPFHHKDPFDRILVAQTLAESATLVSNDPKLTQYGVTVIW